MDKVREAYDKIAIQYGGYRRALWPPVVNFLKSLKPSKILDIGSGTGHYIPRFVYFGHKVTISDISIEHLKLAKKSGIRSPSFVSDASNMSIKEGSFDAITSIAVLHHMLTKKERVNFFREIKRILKPKGQAMITTFGLNPESRSKSFSGKLKFGEIKRDYYFMNQKDIETCLSEAKIRDYSISSKKTKSKLEIGLPGKETKSMFLGNYFIKIKN